MAEGSMRTAHLIRCAELARLPNQRAYIPFLAQCDRDLATLEGGNHKLDSLRSLFIGRIPGMNITLSLLFLAGNAVVKPTLWRPDKYESGVIQLAYPMLHSSHSPQVWPSGS